MLISFLFLGPTQFLFPLNPVYYRDEGILLREHREEKKEQPAQRQRRNINNYTQRMKDKFECKKDCN